MDQSNLMRATCSQDAWRVWQSSSEFLGDPSYFHRASVKLASTEKPQWSDGWLAERLSETAQCQAYEKQSFVL